MIGTVTVTGMTTGATTATMATTASLHHQEGAHHQVSPPTNLYLMLAQGYCFLCLP